MKIKTKTKAGSRNCGGGTPVIGFGFLTGARAARSSEGAIKPKLENAMKIKTKIKSGSRNCDIFIGLPADWRSVPRVC